MATAIKTPKPGKAQAKAAAKAETKSKLADYTIECKATGAEIINHLGFGGQTYCGQTAEGEAWSKVGALTAQNAVTVDCKVGCKKAVAKALRGVDVGDPPTEILAGAVKTPKAAKEPKPPREKVVKVKKSDAPVAEVVLGEITQLANRLSTVQATCQGCGFENTKFTRSWAGIGWTSCANCGARLNWPKPKGEARKVEDRAVIEARKAERAAKAAARKAEKAAKSGRSPAKLLEQAEARFIKATTSADRFKVLAEKFAAKVATYSDQVSKLKAEVDGTPMTEVETDEETSDSIEEVVPMP